MHLTVRSGGLKLESGCITRLGEAGPVRFHVGGKPNGLVFGPDGETLFCDAEANSIRRLDPVDGSTSIYVAGADAALPDRPNDLAFDSNGRLVFTCPDNSRTDPTGRVWSARAGETPRLVAEGLHFRNGLAFSADGRTLFVAETYRHQLWKGEYDPAKGLWINPLPFVELGGPVGPDGIALSDDGALYVAVFGQDAIKRVTPNGLVFRCR